MENGFILHSYEIDEDKLKSIIKNTNIRNYKFMQNLKEMKKAFKI